MSGLVVGLTLQHLPGDSHTHLAVALVLADQADQQGGNIYPSIATIAALSRLSERSAQYVMRDLQELGYLELEKKGGGRGKPSRYRIRLDWLAQRPNRLAAVRAARAAAKGASDAPITETVHDRESEPEKVQKGCTKGEPAGAPDPLTRDPISFACSAAGADAPVRAEKDDQKRKTKEFGVLCWTPKDRQDVADLVAGFGTEAVGQAAQEIERQGGQPLPSYVGKLLRKGTVNGNGQNLRPRGDDTPQSLDAQPVAGSTGDPALDHIRARFGALGIPVC